jgi:hypothetical protein
MDLNTTPRYGLQLAIALLAAAVLALGAMTVAGAAVGPNACSTGDSGGGGGGDD